MIEVRDALWHLREGRARICEGQEIGSASMVEEGLDRLELAEKKLEPLAGESKGEE